MATFTKNVTYGHKVRLAQKACSDFSAQLLLKSNLPLHLSEGFQSLIQILVSEPLVQHLLSRTHPAKIK